MHERRLETFFPADRTTECWFKASYCGNVWVLIPYKRVLHMIDLEQIKAMFANVTENAGWDLGQPMEWGYFFTDRKRAKLETALRALQKQGFTFVDIFMPQLEQGEEDYFFLHVVKVDVHTPESLLEQNARLYALAETHALDSYDGMDVGPVTMDKPGIPSD